MGIIQLCLAIKLHQIIIGKEVIGNKMVIYINKMKENPIYRVLWIKM